MARDDKKAKNKHTPGKDKDIHLNVVGVPPKNVHVNKTKPSDNNEEYQLYRISIDTSGKEKERKHRIGSLEPSSKPKSIKNRKRFRSRDSEVLSSDSESDQPKTQKPKIFGGHTPKMKPPKTKRKGEVDSEICFTIPGEKGKAIKIVGSSTKPRNDSSATSSRVQSGGSAPRQVGFAGLDEVYGTTPEESLNSSEYVPYERAPPQVYKVENTSLNPLFRDPSQSRYKTGPNAAPGSEDNIKTMHPFSPALKNGQDEQSKQSSNGRPKSLIMGKSIDQRKISPIEDKVLHDKVHRTGSRMLDSGRPSTSKGIDTSELLPPHSKQKDDVRGASYLNSSSRPDPTAVSKGFDTESSALPSTSHNGSSYSFSKASAESKGKYPFYPYDKQKKRGRPPTELSQELIHDKGNDEHLGKSEPYSHQKLPSILEVRSTELAAGTPETNSLPKSFPTDRFKNDDRTKAVSKPLSARQQPHWNKSTPSFENLNETPNPIHLEKPAEVNNSTSTSNTKTETSQPRKNSISIHDDAPLKLVDGTLRIDKAKSIPPQKSLHLTTTSENNREPLNEKSIEDEKLMSDQTKKPAQINTSTSPLQSKVQDNGMHPVMSYNGQNTPLPKETTNKNKFVRQIKFEPGLDSKATRPLESSIYRLLNDSTPKEPLKLVKGSTHSTNSNLNHKKLPFGNIIRNSKTRYETGSKEIMTKIPTDANEKIMQEIQSELSRKPSPSSKKSVQDHSERKKLGVDKVSKSKSKLLTFVSSIPKPLFRRHKSPALDANKTSHKSVQQLSTQPKLNLPRKDDTENGARKPVVESSIVKLDHEPTIQPYPAWLTSPESRPHQLKSQSSSPGSPKNESTKSTASQRGRQQVKLGETEPVGNINSYLPVGITDDSPSVEIANRSYGEYPSAIEAGTSPRASEETTRSTLAGEEDAENKLGEDNKMEEIDSESLSSLTDEKSKYHPHSDQSVMDKKDSEYKDGKYGDNFKGANILAYPGRINEQTPFGYESQFARDQSEENYALESLEEAYEEKGRRLNDEPPKDSKSSPKTGDVTGPGSDGNKSDYKPGKQSTVDLQHSRHSLKEAGRDPKQEITSKGEKVFKQEKQPDDGLPEFKKDGRSLSQTKFKLDQSPHGTVYGQFPVQNTVYLGQVPDNTFSVFNASESKRDPHSTQGKFVSPLFEAPGPKGILIFVNKKNETASPFERNAPSRKKGNQSTKDKKEGPKKKKLKRKSSKSSGTSLATTSSAHSSKFFTGGDKKVKIERSPSGKKTTQKYPCGCFRVIINDPENQIKREDLISAYCRKGSQCDVRNSDKKKKLKRKDSLSTYSGDQSSNMALQGKKLTPTEMFPEIEVLAEGVMSRKPIKSKKPAATMNGANLTGSLNVKSNKFNGVYNFYLDKKLKNYLLNNMDRFKQLLQDNPRSKT